MVGDTNTNSLIKGLSRFVMCSNVKNRLSVESVTVVRCRVHKCSFGLSDFSHELKLGSSYIPFFRHEKKRRYTRYKVLLFGESD